MPTPTLITTAELARLAFPDLPQEQGRCGKELAAAMGIGFVELRGRFYVNRAAALKALETFPEKPNEPTAPPARRPARRSHGDLLRHLAAPGA